MTPLLAASGITVTFGGLHALQDVSVSVVRGQIVGLIGPNGAGKTTLFNVLSGLQRTTAGTVALDGTDITDLPVSRRAALGIGRSFQNLGLMHDESVLVNVLAAQHTHRHNKTLDPYLHPLRWRQTERELRRRGRAALSAFGIDRLQAEVVDDLSFAAARFAELAAVVVQEPQLLLLDEPTTGLDLEETARLADVLLGLRARGATILLVAHDVRFVMELCDYLFVLAEGRLLEEGTPGHVQRSPRVAEAYLGRSA